MIVIGYKKCSTCKKLEKILKDKQIDYIYRHINEDNPKADELRVWKEKSNLELKKFFNTSGLLYRTLNLKDKVKTLDEEQLYDLLEKDGMLVKRPIILVENRVYIGRDAMDFAGNLKKFDNR